MATGSIRIDVDLVHRFAMGGLNCISLSDGYIPTTTKITAPEIPEAELAAFLTERGEHPTEKATLITCLLVEMPGLGQVIVDAGIGTLPGPGGKPIATAGRLPEALKAAGIDPESIETMLVSHIHPDHIGGLFADDERPLFPNATYYVPQEEMDFWSAPAPDLSGSLLPPLMRIDTIAAAHRFLRLAKDRTRTFRAGEDPVPGVKSILLPGHTPGQVGFLFEGEGEAMLYSADAAGHNFISLERPDWRFSFDADAVLAIATRKALIARLIGEGWYNFTPHFPWPGFGRVEDRDGIPTWRAGR